ncbi:ABC transporter ATP-binding protein [Halorarum salinum]|uniref:ABC transporter ATP-binding protein n=1 Tax=Halorarum salinum TaxID=2743089 RepID=A0A7D5QAF4_9EURY|nr:ABC transporter ATP-binding protein [Halobaculum salinum]QLG62377.1 ABC transporter ATP-binding protein [Halobaculum salinum]
MALTSDAGREEAAPAVEFDGVSKVYDPEGEALRALDGVEFAVDRGEFVCIVGPSGCGKSTLFRIVAGLENATSGEVTVDGRPVEGPGPDRGMVFQDDALFPWRTVLGNVTYGLEEVGTPGDDTVEGRARHCLDLVGLSEFADAYPKSLSGGQRQRVGIARALAVDPPILLMDEPFASVDERTKATLHAELLDIWEGTEKTVLFVTHDVEEAVYLADRIVVLTDRPGSVAELVPVDRPRPRDRTGEAFTAVEDRVLSHFRD